jgi:hypothetical protein
MAENMMGAGRVKLLLRKSLKSRLRSPVSWCAGAGILGSLLPAIACALADPTQPPGLSTHERVIESNRLQTVIISSVRRAAIIDGQMIELGAKHGDVRLIEVSESGVVLLGGQGRVVLHLFPVGGINKTMILLPAPEEFKQVASKHKLIKTSAEKKERK